MIKVIKKGIPYVLAIGVACVIMLFVNFANRYQMTPKHVYKVYLDGKSIGNIADKLDMIILKNKLIEMENKNVETKEK